MRIGVLNNLRAGRSGAQVSRILAALRDYPEVAHVETNSARMLPEALAELDRHEIDVLVLNGGDGTLQFALSELLGDPDRDRVPWIAPLRGGRTNMTASDLGAHRKPVVGLRRLLEAASRGDLESLRVSRPVLRVRSSRRAGVQYGMFFGIGVIYRGVRMVHRVFPPGQSQGLFGASLVTGALVARTLFRPTEGIVMPDKCELRLGEASLPDSEFYLLCSTTLERLFLNMNPFWGEGSGGIRVTALGSRVERLAAATPGILRGKPRARLTTDNGYTSERVERAELRIGCGFTVDGELFHPEPDEVIEIAADRRIAFLRA